jgi:hypothetical protein
MGKGLPGGKRLKHVICAGASLLEMLRNTRALFRGETWSGGKEASQRDCDIVNIVHQADGFSGEWHGRIPSM